MSDANDINDINDINEEAQEVLIGCERFERYALVAIDHQARDNVRNHAAVLQLIRTFTRLRDDPEVRAVVLTGFEELPGLGPEQAAADERDIADLLASIEGLGKPVIGAVKGLATGAGCELALVCSWRIASAAAQFAIPRGAFSRLSQLIGKSRALEMISTGEPAGAEEALRAGLVERIVEGGAELKNVCDEQARRIGRNAPLAVKYALEAINRGIELPISDGLQMESSLFSMCFATADFREGVRAFLEKREPVFHGE
jgi:enoyl-CoA hydratase